MGIIISPTGLGVDWHTDLPFDNSMDVRFQVGKVTPEIASPFAVDHNTHLWLLFSSASLLKAHDAAGEQVYCLVRPADGVLDDPFRDALCRGLWDADKSGPYNDPAANLIPTWRSHFYDPDTRTNWMGDASPTALSMGSRYYRRSLRAYREGRLEKAGHSLGLSLHYLTDLTQPMHAANFTWMSSRGMGYHTDFERYVKNVLGQMSPPRRYAPLLPESDHREYFHAVARYTKDRYFEALCKPEWTQNYTGEARSDAVWETRVGALVPAILADAVQMAAQFLLMWVREATAVQLVHA